MISDIRILVKHTSSLPATVLNWLLTAVDDEYGLYSVSLCIYLFISVRPECSLPRFLFYTVCVQSETLFQFHIGPKQKVFIFQAYFSYFENMKVGLCYLHAVCISVNPSPFHFLIA
jgi:hypothetical protein